MEVLIERIAERDAEIEKLNDQMESVRIYIRSVIRDTKHTLKTRNDDTSFLLGMIHASEIILRETTPRDSKGEDTDDKNSEKR